jgi:hypothetical protein
MATFAMLWPKAATAGGTDAIHLEIFEKFHHASASIRFNKSFLLETPVT